MFCLTLMAQWTCLEVTVTLSLDLFHLHHVYHFVKHFDHCLARDCVFSLVTNDVKARLTFCSVFSCANYAAKSVLLRFTYLIFFLLVEFIFTKTEAKTSTR